MGLGGDLIWTAVLKAVHDRDQEAPVACSIPLVSDLLAGRLYDGSKDCRENQIFRNSPFIAFTEAHRKGAGARALDTAGVLILKVPAFRCRYEDWVFRRAEHSRSKGGAHFIHIDMRRHSYAAHQTRRKTYWKGGRALDAIAVPFGIDHVEATPNLHFSDSENRETERLLSENHIQDKPFITVEPDTNRDWFGELRAWPLERWQALVDRLRVEKPDVPVVQIGLGRSGVLSGTVDLTGKTDFRGASRLIREAALFIGTEGGLMHAARAVNAQALILWGGITLPEFIGYPDHQTTICKYVDCAPCGNAGWCDYGHRCMREITVDEVFDAAVRCLSSHPAD